MNEGARFRLLSALSYLVIALLAALCLVGALLFLNLGKLGEDLPVKTVDQFRNISNIMPLVSELDSGIEGLSRSDSGMVWKKLDFTLGKLRIARELVLADFDGDPPESLALILEELSLVERDLSAGSPARSSMSGSGEILLRTRIGYIYTELRDYVLRINNGTLITLGKQKAEIEGLKTAIIAYSAMALAAAALTYSLLRSRKWLFGEMREKRAAALAASKAKSEFLSNMSHEIRTPMNAIIGLSYLALKTSLTPGQRDYVKRIQSSGHHLLGVINDILDISKIEAGKMSLEIIPFELDKVLDNVANLIAEKAGAKGLELIFETGKNVPRDLLGDPLRLGQVLINFANNAVKFTERGEICIRIRLEGESDRGVMLHFEVRDTGIGIEESRKAELFRSFQQADGTIARRYGGTGLGLAISKSIAEMMGGEVGVESCAGEGSTFWFTALFGRGGGARRYIPDPDLRGRKVLVADDNDHAAAVMLDMLRSMTFSARAVASGQAALGELRRAAAEGSPYEIAFLDWQMPGMDGIEAAKRLRDEALSPATRVVIVTAYGREDLIREAEAAGIENVLIKPVSASILLDTAVLLFGASRSKRPAAEDASIEDADSGLEGAKVLLAEDNAINQEVAIELLQKAGCEVSVAWDGGEAVAKAGDGDFDMVLMDVQMPLVDGLAATREIRKLPGRSGLPIIAMTANAMSEDRARCLEAGMNDYITKPIDPDAMFETMRKYYSSPKPRRGRASAEGSGSPASPRPSEADLPAIAGVDAADGLRRVMGNKSLYLDLLGRFAEGQRDAPRRLREALDGGDRALAERIAHTVKGVAGNIGAAGAQAAAGGLEAAIAGGTAGESLDEKLGSFEEAMASAVAGIESALVGGPPPGGAGSPAERASAAGPVRRRAAEALEDLRRYAQESDCEASDCLESSRTELIRAYGQEAYESLRTALRAYDFKAVISIADSLKGPRDGGGTGKDGMDR